MEEETKRVSELTVAQIEALIEQGADPTVLMEAAKAGGSVVTGEDDNGHTLIQVLYEKPEMTPESGFDTIGVEYTITPPTPIDELEGLFPSELGGTESVQETIVPDVVGGVEFIQEGDEVGDDEPTTEPPSTNPDEDEDTELPFEDVLEDEDDGVIPKEKHANNGIGKGTSQDDGDPNDHFKESNQNDENSNAVGNPTNSANFALDAQQPLQGDIS